MAILTPLDLETARAIGARFGLRVAGSTALVLGSVNSNFELALEGPGPARVFLRVYEEQTDATAAREAALLEQLAARGLPVAKPLALREGDPGAPGFLASHAGKPVAVFPWIEGRSTCSRDVTPERMRALGCALGVLHASGDTRLVAPSDRFGARGLLARVAKARGHERATDEVRAACDRVERGLELELAREPVRDAVVHGDLFRDNVLWRDETSAELAALLDFESASLGSALFDVAVTLLAWCYRDALELDRARALFEGYAATTRVSPDDAPRLLAELRFACLRFATTRITDYELRPRGLGEYRDFRRFLARLDAVEALGEPGLRALLA